MLIDWFTVGAQALNFIILVWLMKRFLYKPVLDAIAAREKRIADQLAAAASKETQAETERREFADRNRDFDQQRTRLLAEATAAATAQGERLLEQATQAAAALALKHQQTLQSQAAQLQETLGNRARDEVFAIARKALADLADAGLEERIIAVFVRRLRQLSEPDRVLLGKAFTSTSEPAQVRSTFELSAMQRDTIQSAVNEVFGADVALRFQTAPEAISGIELRAGGRKLAWSIADYLASLQGAVAALMVSPAGAVPAPAPAVAADSTGTGK